MHYPMFACPGMTLINRSAIRLGSASSLLTAKCGARSPHHQLLSVRTIVPMPTSIEPNRIVLYNRLDRVELGESILELQQNGAPGPTKTDETARLVRIAKTISLASSTLGLVMLPVLNSQLGTAMADNPWVSVFGVLANGLLITLTFTPLLLHTLTKRFVLDVFFQRRNNIFTIVRYNFLLQKMAIRFQAKDVIDAAKAAESKRFGLHLATCYIYQQPLLLSLDESQYRDKEAFKLLTTKIDIPQGHD